ncbi:SspB family protein [Paracraurococcus ruber]|uniref:Stringent starvation protein B n=1 Tax=Paracraurococcus ruber TaxID=77675 RepID=A0ABS1CRY5_9PROT|nr:ClpXP protease specificity-enhancing factor SspB [Paracraurococcus ruber]MBK1657123.1 hypothetical protein [Paracraurococcus ruber]TDG31706.1 hypothetical protein E2C05_10000 [Paracraurococcus ruber]
MNEPIAPAESLLPYAAWSEEALRAVALEALEHAAKQGLPGEHHFYLTFQTSYPGVNIPGHLKARYPQDMTIVLQHKFWDLKVDRGAGTFSVGLSFGGVPATLVVPFKALTAFADPKARFGLRFTAPEPAAASLPEVRAPEMVGEAKPQVVSLDAFRRKRD